jgi:hypothetical protein
VRRNPNRACLTKRHAACLVHSLSKSGPIVKTILRASNSYGMRVGQLQEFFRIFGADQFVPVTSRGSTRARSSSKPARPYICRLITFSRLICPSNGPLLRGVSIANVTGPRSRPRVFANCPTQENPEAIARFIHPANLSAVHQRSSARELQYQLA